MNRILFIVIGFLLAGMITAANGQTEVKALENGSILLADFQDEPVGDLPRRWYNRDGDALPYTYTGEDRAGYQYDVVEEDGRRFLRFQGFEAKHMNLPLHETKEIDLKETPYLSWEWRAHILPTGGNEEDRRRNDVAASVYVVYSLTFLRQPRVIRYTWSTELPKGHESSMNMGNMKIVVLESGTENIGEWIRFERNIREDYKRMFGRTPPDRPIAILILSDADDTESFAKADYDNFMLHPETKE